MAEDAVVRGPRLTPSGLPPPTARSARCNETNEYQSRQRTQRVRGRDEAGRGGGARQIAEGERSDAS